MGDRAWTRVSDALPADGAPSVPSSVPPPQRRRATQIYNGRVYMDDIGGTLKSMAERVYLIPAEDPTPDE